MYRPQPARQRQTNTGRKKQAQEQPLQSSPRQQPSSYSPYCSTGSDVSCVEEENDIRDVDAKTQGKSSHVSQSREVKLNIHLQKNVHNIGKQSHLELETNQTSLFDRVNELNQL